MIEGESEREIDQLLVVAKRYLSMPRLCTVWEMLENDFPENYRTKLYSGGKITRFSISNRDLECMSL